MRLSAAEELAGLHVGTSECNGKILPDDVLDILDRLPWVRAMQRAAYGYTDGIPVRYMSLKENRANNQTEEGRPKEGRGQSPTPLADPPKPLSIEIPAQPKSLQTHTPAGGGGHAER